MTLRTLYLYIQVVIEFFTWEAIWGASAMLKAIYYSRIVLMAVPLVAALALIHSVQTWPEQRPSDGEERLVLQGEFRASQERDREIQQELRSEVASQREQIRDLWLRQTKSEEFQRRIEDKFDLGMKVLWAMCSLLIVQVVVPLLKVGLQREIRRIKLIEDEP